MNSNSSLPLISVIVPAFNSERYIRNTIASIQSQSFTDWEVIIVDDNSSDKTVSLLEVICAEDDRVKLIKLNENFGAAFSRNQGIRAARGRYIAFLDSDDIWLPEKLEQQLMFMTETGNAFSFTRVARYDEQGNQLSTSKIPDKVNYHTLLKTNVVVCSSAMYDTHQLGKVYMPDIRKRQDFALWLLLLKRCDYGYGLQETLVKYTVREGSISSNRMSAAHYTWRVYREVEQLSFLKSLYCFTHYSMNAFIRIKLPRLARKFGLLN